MSTSLIANLSARRVLEKKVEWLVTLIAGFEHREVNGCYKWRKPGERGIIFRQFYGGVRFEVHPGPRHDLVVFPSRDPEDVIEAFILSVITSSLEVFPRERPIPSRCYLETLAVLEGSLEDREFSEGALRLLAEKGYEPATSGRENHARLFASTLRVIEGLPAPPRGGRDSETQKVWA